MFSFEPTTIPNLQPAILCDLLKEFSSKQFLLFFAISKLTGFSLRIKLYGLSFISKIFFSSQKEIKSLKKDNEQFDPVGIFG